MATRCVIAARGAARGNPPNRWVQLTEVPDATYPIWSPDGSRIAVYVLATKDYPENAYVFDPNRPWRDQTPEILPKLDKPAASFVVNSWSPDGERLAGTAGLTAHGLVVYSLRSKTFERLTDLGEWPAWLPDSRQLLFVSGGKDFHVLDTKSKNVREGVLGHARCHWSAPTIEERPTGILLAPSDGSRHLARHNRQAVISVGDQACRDTWRR